MYARLLTDSVAALVKEPGGDRKTNLLRAIACNLDAAELRDNDLFRRGCYAGAAGIHGMLAQRGLDPRANLEAAADLYGRASTAGGRDQPFYAACVIGEAGARQELAGLGVEPRSNARTAIELYEQARPFITDRRELARCLVDQGRAYRELARWEPDGRACLERAVRLCREARDLLPRGEELAACLYHEARACQSLAQLEVDAPKNLERAITLFDQIRALITAANPQFGRSLVREAAARPTTKMTRRRGAGQP